MGEITCCAKDDNCARVGNRPGTEAFAQGIGLRLVALRIHPRGIVAD
jgi:hypothetical protein